MYWPVRAHVVSLSQSRVNPPTSTAPQLIVLLCTQRFQNNRSPGAPASCGLYVQDDWFKTEASVYKESALPEAAAAHIPVKVIYSTNCSASLLYKRGHSDGGGQQPSRPFVQVYLLHIFLIHTVTLYWGHNCVCPARPQETQQMVCCISHACVCLQYSSTYGSAAIGKHHCAGR